MRLVPQIHIPLDASSSPKGFAYVRFKDPSLAVAAHQALDGTSFQGRLIHILPAVDRNPRPKDDTNNNKTARLRDVRAHQKKENSGKDFNWAVLYMNVRPLYCRQL
jgi:multiple RNA-binding domain-containing protein 1